MTRRLALALAGIAAVVAVAVVVAAGRDPGAPPLRDTALSAEALVDSIGVNVHFSYVDTAYARQADVLARLQELGVRHIRDGMPITVPAWRAGIRAASRRGIRPTLIGDPAVAPAELVTESVGLAGEAIAAFEGPNELDAAGADAAWPATLRAYMPALASAVRRHAPHVPLIGPSFIDPANRSRVSPDLPGLLNAHPYPYGAPPEPTLGEALRGLRSGVEEPGVFFTETGYHNAMAATAGQPPVSEQAAAVYLPRALVTAFGAGVRRTFIYELVDEKPDPGLVDQEQHFGLLRTDLSPKPAFTAIQTLIAALRRSPGAAVDRRLPWTLEVGGEAKVERLTLARRDGSSVLALWRPVPVWDEEARRPLDPEPLAVELRFGREARDVDVWRPSLSTEPVMRRARAQRMELALEGDLVLVSLR